MPPYIRPYSTKKIAGVTVERLPLDDPLDWSTRLLGVLAMLSGLLPNEPKRAHQVLLEAVAWEGRSNLNPQLSPGDVARVIRQVGRESAGTVVPGTQPTHSVDAAPQSGAVQAANGNVAGSHQRKVELQLPSPDISQTSCRTIQIKQESSPSAIIRQNSVDIAEAFSNQWQQARTKRRRNLQDDLEDIELQQKALKVKRQLRALEDGDDID